LTQDFYVIDEDAREEAKENLTQQIARKMEDALNDKQDSNEFEDQFDKDEKKQLTRMKCRLYIDNRLFANATSWTHINNA
jgi:hypothetical protein